MNKTNNEPKMPECERMRAVKDQSQAIGAFLEWVRSTKGWTLTEPWTDEYGRESRIPASFVMEDLLAEFFKIDLKKVEEEKCALLDHIRREHDPT